MALIQFQSMPVYRQDRMQHAFSIMCTRICLSGLHSLRSRLVSESSLSAVSTHCQWQCPPGSRD
eukprot:4303996-Pyramimonas_sp.AAC.2